MTLCNFVFYILDYLEVIQNSLAAYNGERPEMVRDASVVVEMPKAQTTMVS